MASVQETFSLDLPLSEVMRLCQRVIVSLYWLVTRQTTNSMECKSPVYNDARYFVHIEINLTEQSPTSTRVELHGHSFWPDWIIANSTQKNVMALRNGMEIEAENPRYTKAEKDKPSANLTLASELQKLAQLHAQDLITDEEYSKAKAKLLNT